MIDFSLIITSICCKTFCSRLLFLLLSLVFLHIRIAKPWLLRFLLWLRNNSPLLSEAQGHKGRHHSRSHRQNRKIKSTWSTCWQSDSVFWLVDQSGVARACGVLLVTQQFFNNHQILLTILHSSFFLFSPYDVQYITCKITIYRNLAGTYRYIN